MRAILLGCLLALPRVVLADEPGPQGGPGETPPAQPKKEAPPTEETPPPKQESEKPIIYKQPIRPREIVVDIPGVRSTETRLVLGGLAAATLIVGGVGLYFHVASRNAANDVSRQLFKGETWTQDRQDRVEDAERSKTRAIVGYTVGGLLLTGTIVALIITEPKSERSVIRPRHAGLAPVPGGAIAGAGWSF